MKKIIDYSVYIFLIYIYIHNPIFSLLGIGSEKLLYIYIAIMLIYSTAALMKCFGELKKELAILVLGCAYICIRTMFVSDFSKVYTSLILLIEEYFLPIGIVCYLEQRQVGKEDFVRLILMVGAVGAVISSLCVFIPAINQSMKDLFVINDYLENNHFRGFGISEGLTYSYGIIQGIIFSYALFNIKNNKWFIVFMPFVMLSILFNARVGFLIVIIGVILFYLFNRDKTIGIVLSAIMLVGVLIFPYTSILFEKDTLEWVQTFFDELAGLTKNDIQNSTFETLFIDMMVLPEGVYQWIFGSGRYIYLARHNTDMGWLLQLNLGGVIFMFFLFWFLKALYNHLKWCAVDKSLIFFMIGTILVANTKGDFLNNTGGFRLLLLISYYYILTSRKNYAILK